jgi:hypothetical protein
MNGVHVAHIYNEFIFKLKEAPKYLSIFYWKKHVCGIFLLFFSVVVSAIQGGFLEIHSFEKRVLFFNLRIFLYDHSLRITKSEYLGQH